jgi:hypothetical protein
VHEERKNCEAGVLLGSFWYGAIFRTQFAILLFLRGLMYSILSFYYRTKFRCKESLFKKQVEVIYPNYSQAFLKRTFYCEGDLVEKTQSGYLLYSSDFFGGTLWGKGVLVKKLCCGYLL